MYRLFVPKYWWTCPRLSSARHRCNRCLLIVRSQCGDRQLRRLLLQRIFLPGHWLELMSGLPSELRNMWQLRLMSAMWARLCAKIKWIMSLRWLPERHLSWSGFRNMCLMPWVMWKLLCWWLQVSHLSGWVRTWWHNLRQMRKQIHYLRRRMCRLWHCLSRLLDCRHMHTMWGERSLNKWVVRVQRWLLYGFTLQHLQKVR